MRRIKMFVQRASPMTQQRYQERRFWQHQDVQYGEVDVVEAHDKAVAQGRIPVRKPESKRRRLLKWIRA